MSHILTIFIPTYNRAPRLSKNLNLLFDQINRAGLHDQVMILVGDNASTDETFEVCRDAQFIATSLGIQYSYYRNRKNTGLGGNIKTGTRKAKSTWLMFFSDDDNLSSGTLQSICNDLVRYSPQIAICNFDQKPFDIMNPLIRRTTKIQKENGFAELEFFVKWSKLSGVIVRNRNNSTSRSEIEKALSNAHYFPHVILAILLYSKVPSLLKISTFIGYPDEDFLEHVNFPPYITEYLLLELRLLRANFNLESIELDEMVRKYSRVDVLKSSCFALIEFYKGSRRLTRSLKKKLWSNLLRFILGYSSTRDHLHIGKPDPESFVLLMVTLILAMVHKPFLWVKNRKIMLMPEGF